MGVARGGTWAMVTKIYKFYNVSPILPTLKKAVLRLSEHDDFIETQTLKICPPHIFFANSAHGCTSYNYV